MERDQSKKKVKEKKKEKKRHLALLTSNFLSAERKRANRFYLANKPET